MLGKKTRYIRQGLLWSGDSVLSGLICLCIWSRIVTCSHHINCALSVRNDYDFGVTVSRLARRLRVLGSQSDSAALTP